MGQLYNDYDSKYRALHRTMILYRGEPYIVDVGGRSDNTHTVTLLPVRPNVPTLTLVNTGTDDFVDRDFDIGYMNFTPLNKAIYLRTSSGSGQVGVCGYTVATDDQEVNRRDNNWVRSIDMANALTNQFVPYATAEERVAAQEWSSCAFTRNLAIQGRGRMLWMLFNDRGVAFRPSTSNQWQFFCPKIVKLLKRELDTHGVNYRIEG